MIQDRRIPFITSAGVPVDPRNIIVSALDSDGNINLAVSVITGSIDCSANPNFPAATAGALYLVIVAGKIGGASGVIVEAGDMAFCTVTNAGGTQAQVGADWDVLQTNLTAAQLAALIHAAASKNPPVDDDEFALADSAAAFGLKKLTWANLKAVLVALIPGKTTGAAIITGTNDTDFATPKALHDAGVTKEAFIMACSDETTSIPAATDKMTMLLPYAFNVDEVIAFLTHSNPSGAIFTVDINKNGTTILSTLLTIDNGEASSLTAAIPPVISVPGFAKGDVISVDVDQVGNAGAAGLKVYAIGRKS